jgi:hypothetical protein
MPTPLFLVHTVLRIMPPTIKSFTQLSPEEANVTRTPPIPFAFGISLLMVSIPVIVFPRFPEKQADSDPDRDHHESKTDYENRFHHYGCA